MFSPFGDIEQSANLSAAWHPEPQFRGTYGILSSCIITLGLCIWTAVHLNLPEHGKAKAQVWRKTKWLFIALLAPEIIVWTAFEQRREAKIVRALVCKALGKAPKRTNWQKMLDSVLPRKRKSREPDNESNMDAETRPTRKHGWTMVHAHFAVMGGFCFDTNDAELNFLPGDRTRVTLSSRGVISLAKLAPELLPDMSKEQILDKSKADGFGKTLACLQALWFCTQCISRLATGLPITLLELNTFAHALCTLLAYAFWWSKPHDVNEPVLIQGPAVHTICAAMCMRSRMGAEYPSEGYFSGDSRVARIWQEGIGFLCVRDIGLPESLVAYRAVEESEPRPIYSAVHLQDMGDTTVSCNEENKLALKVTPNMRLYMGQSLSGFGYRRRNKYYSILRNKLPEVGVLHFRRPFINLASSDVLRWRLASEGLQSYPELLNLLSGQDYRADADNNNKKMHRRFLTEFCIDRVSNLPTFELSDSGQDSMTVVYTFLIAGLGYGMLHLSAWGAPFRSHVEAFLWKLSAITLTVSGFVPLLCLGALAISFPILDSKICKGIGEFIAGLQDGNAAIRWMILWPLMVVSTLAIYGVMSGCALIYLFSRVYVILECFLKLPYLPPAALTMPPWSQ